MRIQSLSAAGGCAPVLCSGNLVLFKKILVMPLYSGSYLTYHSRKVMRIPEATNFCETHA